MGWLTCEEVLYNAEGRLLTPGPSTYKIPAAGDVPDDFTVNLLANAPNNRVIGGSKAVGEPPFLLAISVVTALRHTITTYSVEALPVELTLPATPESVLRGIAHQKGEPTS
jgi:xanthine dehydrogenase large subunit